MTKCISPSFDPNEVRPLPPFVVPPTEPLSPGPRGVAIRVLVRSSQTGYQYSCVETSVAPRTVGPSPHLHDRLDELALVLEGTLSVMVGDSVFEVPAGGMMMRPRGLVHSFWNSGDVSLRFLDMFLGQNFDEYLEAFFELMDEMARNGSSWTDPQVGGRLAELDREFGVTQFPERRREILDKYFSAG